MSEYGWKIVAMSYTKDCLFASTFSFHYANRRAQGAMAVGCEVGRERKSIEKGIESSRSRSSRSLLLPTARSAMPSAVYVMFLTATYLFLTLLTRSLRSGCNIANRGQRFEML